MPSFVTTIEDYSPLVVYSSDWSQGSSGSDNQASSYSDSSFTATNTGGGTATFTFNGTGIEIFGAKRDNHGNYQVKVDSNSFPILSGEASDPVLFQQQLFSNTGLSNGQHTVTLTNLGTNGQFVDVDFITFHSSIGAENEQLYVNTVQDSDPAFLYSPSDSWSDTPSNLGFFSGSSGHSTSSPGASFTYAFQGKSPKYSKQFAPNTRIGDAVSLYGPVGPAYSPYSVQLNGQSLSFSAQKKFNTSSVLLYHANSLGSGTHSLKLLVQPSSTGQVFAIDYAQVYSTPSTGDSSSSTSHSSSHTLSPGAIAGLVIGVLAIAGILLVAFWWYLRKRSERYSIKSLESQDFSIQQTNAAPIVVAYPVVHQAPFASESRLIPSEATDFMAAHPVSDVTSEFDARDSSPSRYLSSHTAHTRSLTNSTSPRLKRVSSSVGHITKGRTLTLPDSTGQSLEGVATDELRSNRMVVEGRPQDFGSLSDQVASGSGSGEVSQSYAEHHPPPDYSQATEAYDR